MGSHGLDRGRVLCRPSRGCRLASTLDGRNGTFGPSGEGCLMHARGETVKRGEVVNELHGMILIDVLPGGGGEFERSFLERTGHPVVVCHGPGHAGSCPLLAGAGCELVDSAHGIVFALDLDQEEHRVILRRYHEVTQPEVPIRAVVRPGQRETVRGRARRVRCLGTRTDRGGSRRVRRGRGLRRPFREPRQRERVPDWQWLPPGDLNGPRLGRSGAAVPRATGTVPTTRPAGRGTSARPLVTVSDRAL